MNNKYLIIATFCATILGNSLTWANSTHVAAIDKPTFGVNYDVAMSAHVDQILYNSSKSKLNQMYRGGLSFLYPFYRYLSLGASLDFTMMESFFDRDPRLDLSKSNSKIAPIFLSFSSLIRPQLPLLVMDNLEVLLYSEAQIGIGSVSPITFGTQPLTQRYTYLDSKDIPTPFPLFLETTPKAGLQIFGWQFVGVDVSFGYRMLWVMHPLVTPNQAKGKGLKPDSRGTVYYDVVSPFIQAGIKFAL